jgi:hypothetical protein
MVVLHSNGTMYGNVYLIAFKIEPLSAHAHTHTHICSIDPAIVGSTGGRNILESSGVRPLAFHFMSSRVANRVSWSFIFRTGSSQKSLGARSGDYGGSVQKPLPLPATCHAASFAEFAQ